MIILLPPSETKRFGGRQPFLPEALAHAPPLQQARTQVRAALAAVSGDEAAAVKALKLGKKNRGEREYNLQLDSSGAMPAIDRYTGVLYDALCASELGASARGWIEAHVFIQSALFGLTSAADCIPAYRVSASSRLPKLGTALSKIWAKPHGGVLGGTRYALDLRSKDYAALAPLATLGALEPDFVEVVARSENGEVRALNHFNKAAKGELVRKLAESAPVIENREDLLVWSDANDIEMTAGSDPHTLRLIARQSAPLVNR